MSKKTVYQGQCFLDKVNECTGSVENAFEMAFLNGVSVTDESNTGQELKVSPVTNNVVVEMFNEFKRPATAMKKPPIPPGLGIGYMRIGVNFKIG